MYILEECADGRGSLKECQAVTASEGWFIFGKRESHERTILPPSFPQQIPSQGLLAGGWELAQEL